MQGGVQMNWQKKYGQLIVSDEEGKLNSYR